MQDNQTNLFLRNDTIFGVCEGLGQDLGINPNIFRIAFAGMLYFAPLAVVAGYLLLGIAVALSRWAFPRDASLAATSGSDAHSHGAQAEPANSQDVDAVAA